MRLSVAVSLLSIASESVIIIIFGDKTDTKSVKNAPVLLFCPNHLLPTSSGAKRTLHFDDADIRLDSELNFKEIV